MGSDLARFLIEENLVKSLKIVDNFAYSSDPRRIESISSQVEVIKCDIRDLESFGRSTIGADLVFNFAAETHNDNSITRPLDFVSTNSVGVASVLQAARKNEFHVHQISTDEVFGDLPLESSEPFNENSILRPSSPYSASKASAEMLLMGWSRTFDVKVTLSNSSNNYGDFQHQEKLIPTLISRARQNLPLQLYGNGQNVRDWLHVRDHSMAVWIIATHSESFARYCISAGQLYSNVQVAEMVNFAFGRGVDEIEFVADRPGHDLKYHSDPSRIIEELGWRPVGPSLERFIQSQV